MPFCIEVGDGNWQQWPSGLDCRLQQCSVEFKHTPPVRGASFRENGDIATGVQLRVDLLVDRARVAAAAAVQENCVVACRKPADERPVTNFLL